MSVLLVGLAPSAGAEAACAPAPFSPCVEVVAGETVSASATTSNFGTGVRSPTTGNPIVIFTANRVDVVATPAAGEASGVLVTRVLGVDSDGFVDVSPSEGASGSWIGEDQNGAKTGPSFDVSSSPGAMGDLRSSPVDLFVYVGADGRVFCLGTPEAIVIVASPLGAGIECTDPVSFVPTPDEIVAFVMGIVEGGVPRPPSCLPRDCIPPIPF